MILHYHFNSLQKYIFLITFNNYFVLFNKINNKINYMTLLTNSSLPVTYFLKMIVRFIFRFMNFFNSFKFIIFSFMFQFTTVPLVPYKEILISVFDKNYFTNNMK